ncbi:MAG TPA: transposase [Niabella sp.]|nr:transposase [Niabella sp.]HOZ97474.1 transposase [Niabella sp.]HQW15562.1 transposase [Niabella sp.]HQX20705.1 transposase [Niabella sp.]HQX40941.1 transposase [Niabella sp.]
MLQFSTYYHIFNHANGDDNLFREEKNYSFFLDKYHQHIDPIADTVAWCLMPNHFHLLVKIKREAEVASTFPKFETLEKFEDRSKFVSKQFSNFFSSYSQAFNKVYSRRGSLFIKNFKRKEVATDEYLKILLLYIQLNPVKHGFVSRNRDWQWTSYNHFPDKQPELFNRLFGTVDNYKEQHINRQREFNEYQILESELT